MTEKVLASGVRRTTVNSLLGLAIAAVAGCGPGAANPSPGTTPPAGQTQTSAPPIIMLSIVDKAKQDALIAYRGMWKDFVAAGTTSDWQSPTLGRYATGVALTNMSRSLYADHANGLVTKGEPTYEPAVSSVEPSDNPNKIVITDCSDDSRWLKYKAATGQLANDTPGGRHLINAIVLKQADGSWKVSEYGVHEAGTC
ncbi:hypothetical protein SAMN05192558_10488 [Actinokineospora alba]|uniref:Mce-associated membrane protein n=1 Tax=Actinokineospora alba TaxID=504798 RepID=A0A1H0LC33_9PSEU|nr:hypothetical protein C8E96_2807 [Actinokineospora alba]SDJ02091.1 hypothetical protein SAMN05421871_109209 [Actinokineospora alba]SDO65705.1 hypothetical protein SAMN05192558_10488 [Actinokineospora alba]